MSAFFVEFVLVCPLLTIEGCSHIDAVDLIVILNNFDLKFDFKFENSSGNCLEFGTCSAIFFLFA